MTQSPSLMFVKLVLRLTGEKKQWSVEPFDYAKKRKGNVISPKPERFKGCTVTERRVLGSRVTSLVPASVPTSGASGDVILYFHSGGFVMGPLDLHWTTTHRLATDTRAEVWLVDYPKAPEHHAEEILQNAYEVYLLALSRFEPSRIKLVGDSAGGNLVISLTQRLIANGIALPSKVISISPVADGTLSNPAIAAVDERDPTGARLGLLSTMKMYAGDMDLMDPRVSPIHGSFRGFPPLYLFVASDDLLMPDQKLLALKAKSDNAPVEVIYGEGMFHIWIIVPFLKEGKRDWNKMISILKDA